MPPVIRHISPYAVLLAFLIGISPYPAAALQWLPLASTTRYQATIDKDSVQLTQLGRLAVWLRFVPRGEAQRKAAAADYGEKGYRYHLEYYEIDCSEQSAVLGLIDLFGISGKRLKRLKGGVQPDAIIPGSVLDRAADTICPSLDKDTLDDEAESPKPETETGASTDAQPGSEILLKIEELAKKSVEEPSNIEVLRSLGNAYFDADLPEQAIAVYNRALTLQPDDADILNDQGAMYRQIGEYDKALANFKKAFKINPENLESLYNSGYIYAFDLNDIPKALEVWRQYLTLDNSTEKARTVQGFVDRYQKEKKQ